MKSLAPFLILLSAPCALSIPVASQHGHSLVYRGVNSNTHIPAHEVGTEGAAVHEVTREDPWDKSMNEIESEHNLDTKAKKPENKEKEDEEERTNIEEEVADEATYFSKITAYLTRNREEEEKAVKLPYPEPKTSQQRHFITVAKEFEAAHQDVKKHLAEKFVPFLIEKSTIEQIQKNVEHNIGWAGQDIAEAISNPTVRFTKVDNVRFMRPMMPEEEFEPLLQKVETGLKVLTKKKADLKNANIKLQNDELDEEIRHRFHTFTSESTEVVDVEEEYSGILHRKIWESVEESMADSHLKTEVDASKELSAIVSRYASVYYIRDEYRKVERVLPYKL